MVQAAEDVTVKSPLEMSDEELMNLDPSTLDQFDQPQPAEATGGEAPEVAEAGEAVEEGEQEEVETPEQPAASLEEEEQEGEEVGVEQEASPAKALDEGKEDEGTPEAEGQGAQRNRQRVRRLGRVPRGRGRGLFGLRQSGA